MLIGAGIRFTICMSSMVLPSKDDHLKDFAELAAYSNKQHIFERYGKIVI